MAALIAEFGFCNPIRVDSRDGIIAGHARLPSARKPGLAEALVIVLDHLTSAQRRREAQVPPCGVVLGKSVRLRKCLALSLEPPLDRDVTKVVENYFLADNRRRSYYLCLGI